LLRHHRLENLRGRNRWPDASRLLAVPMTQSDQKAGSQKLVPKQWKLRTARTHSVVCSFPASNPSGIAGKGKARCNRPMGTRSREVIWSSRISGAKMSAEHARQRAMEAAREADRAEAYAWSVRMEGYGGPAQPSPTIAQCLNGGYGWLEVKCHRCETQASLPLDAIRRPRDTPIWKLEAALKCRSCKKGRYAPPVHMIKLTQEREITPYVWVHPEDER